MYKRKEMLIICVIHVVTLFLIVNIDIVTVIVFIIYVISKIIPLKFGGEKKLKLIIVKSAKKNV